MILETSAEAFLIADAALAHGHEVRVVPATLVKTLGVGARGVKNDRRDAQTLSEVSCRIDLPSVHVPSQLARELKSLCGSREILVKSRTMLINNVRGWLRTQLIRIRTGSTPTFQQRVLEYLQTHQLSLPEHIERQLVLLDALKVQVKAADQQLVKLAGEHPVCRKLMTVPGVGPVTAVRFVAAIDDVTRFRNAHAVESYLGLTPGESSSSDRKQHTGITKAGSTEVRRALIQAAWAAFRGRPQEPMVQWATQIAARRGVFIAIVALARKHHVLAVAIVLDVPGEVCAERNSRRTDRDFGPHVLRNQKGQLRRSMKSLRREGFHRVFLLDGVDEIEAHGNSTFHSLRVLRSRNGSLRDNRSGQVAVPPRPPFRRIALASDQLADLFGNLICHSRSPELDGLVFQFLRETACRRSGVIGLRLADGVELVHEVAAFGGFVDDP